MKTFTRFSPLALLLAVGLWACQDQTVAPEVTDLQVEASFAKGGKKPPPPQPQQMWVGFMDPAFDQQPVAPRTLDISADPQLIDAAVNGEGELGFSAGNFELALHFQDELDDMGLTPWGEPWCETRYYTKGIGWQTTEDFNLLQELQNASDDPSTDLNGLVGLLEGSTDRYGFEFKTTLVEGATGDDGYRNGQYWLMTCWGNCSAQDRGEYGPEDIFDGYDYDGFDYWRVNNVPVRVWWRELGATKKGDKWHHRTECGLFPPGSIHRRGSYEVVAKAEGG